MNLFEKLNRLDDSLAEAKMVGKKKKLTESSTQVVSEQPEWFKEFKAKFDATDENGKFELVDYESPFHDYIENLYGDVISDFLNEYESLNLSIDVSTQAGYGGTFMFGEDEEGAFKTYWDTDDDAEMLVDAFECSTIEKVKHAIHEFLYSKLESAGPVEGDYDDDIDEMLTESTEQYELSTLVKDSINHLVNDLSKDPMADDFGDDVCADLENNYDIYVPQNPVKYADWCDAVMNEVSRQLNNREELTESCNYRVKRYGQWHWGIIGPDELLVRQDNGKLLLFKSKDKAVAYIDTLCKNNLTEGNNVSSQLPPAIDDFLQDIAQMYRTITYKDIMEHKYTEDDLKKLRNYRRRFRAEVPYEGDEEADAILNDIAEKVALIIKR